MKIHREEKVTQWTIDQVQSEISFEVSHLVISHVKGEFSQFDATIFTNDSDFSTADISLKIKSKSLNTDDSKLDAQLRGADFLNTDDHKQITFTSTSVSRSSDTDRMNLMGDLTVAGITRNVKLDMRMGLATTDSWGEATACIIINGKLTREQWGLRWSAAMEDAGFLIGDELTIFCKMELYSIGQHDAKKEPDAVARQRSVAS